MKPDSGRLVALDTGVIVLASAAICLAAHDLPFMTVFMPVLLLGRMLGVWVLARHEEGMPLGGELVFFAICTALGAFNDWNSVCNKHIYAYTVPFFFSFSSIPLWMLLYWGMILRYVARFARWGALRPPVEISNRVGIGPWQVESGTVKVAAELVLVLATRQCIYRFYADPLLSWLPFLAALGVTLVVFLPAGHDFRLLAVFLVGGPLIEILYIQVGGLHRYYLGWLGGVPLWIVLWWLVIVLIWKDLAFRIERGLRRVLAG